MLIWNHDSVNVMHAGLDQLEIRVRCYRAAADLERVVIEAKAASSAVRMQKNRHRLCLQEMQIRKNH
jgi:hypothetical protein